MRTLAGTPRSRSSARRIRRAMGGGVRSEARARGAGAGTGTGEGAGRWRGRECRARGAGASAGADAGAGASAEYDARRDQNAGRRQGMTGRVKRGRRTQKRAD